MKLSFACPNCGHRLSVHIQEIDKLRAENANLKAANQALRAKLDQIQQDPFGGLFGGLRGRT